MLGLGAEETGHPSLTLTDPQKTLKFSTEKRWKTQLLNSSTNKIKQFVYTHCYLFPEFMPEVLDFIWKRTSVSDVSRQKQMVLIFSKKIIVDL